MARKKIDFEEAVQGLPRTPMFDAVGELLAIQEKILESSPQIVDLFIAGGTAVHYWTRSRVSTDVDAEFSHRLMITDQNLLYRDEEGKTRTLHFDRNFNTTLGTIHEGYQARAVRVPAWESGSRIRVHVLSPVDLAISKLGRFQDHDQADIRALAAHGLIEKDEFGQLAEEVIGYYVGDKGVLPHNLRRAIQIIEAGRYAPDSQASPEGT